jgi:hypothetical protein
MLTVPIRNRAVAPCLVVAMTVFAGCSTSHAPSVESSSASPAGATAVFGNELSLTGYDIRPKDGHTEMELRWNAVQKPTANYRVFVHALDNSGGLAFQADHDLKDEAGAPTTAWKLGEPVKDQFLVIPWPGHAAEKYTLRLGLFIPLPLPMRILPVANSAFNQPTDVWRNQSIVINNVECK